MSRKTVHLERALLLAALLPALLRCGSDSPKDQDWSHFGPPGDVLEVDPDDVPVAGVEGEGDAGRAGTSAGNGGSAGSMSGAGGTNGGSSGGGGSGGTAGAGVGGMAGGGTAGSANQGGSAGSAGVSGSAGVAGSAGTSGSGATAGIVTSPEGIVFEQQSTLRGLELVSSNLVEEVFDSQQAYYSWFAEVENHATVPACFVDASISFRDATESEIASFLAYADASPYEGSLTLSVPCIPPGGSAGLYDLQNSAPLPIDRIRSAVVEFTHLSGSYIPHPYAPVFTSIAVTPWIADGYWAVSGTLTSVGTIYNIGIEVYPRGPTGLILDRLSDTHLETLFTGTSWDFETVGLESDRFETFLATVEFIEGSARMLPPSGAGSRAEESLRARREVFRRERDQRRADLRARRIAAGTAND